MPNSKDHNFPSRLHQCHHHESDRRYHKNKGTEPAISEQDKNLRDIPRGDQAMERIYHDRNASWQLMLVLTEFQNF
jgi:hypothetical protein